MSRIIVAQLAAASPPGLLLPWARGRGLVVDVVRPDLDEPLPPVRETSGIVVVGADASVRHTWLSWLAPTRAWIAEALATDVPVLGIGFGAQLMASVLGAEIAPAPTPEVGFVRVESEDPAIASGPWLGYNEDTIVLPTAPWTTAFNAHGTQAFRTGPHVGVQFQAHATPDIVRGWARDGRFAVPAELADDASEVIAVIARNARALFSGWATHAGIDVRPAAEPVGVGR